MRNAVLFVAAALVLLGAVTMVALEGDEVVVVRTRGEDGKVRTTRTWIADADGAVWIEAGNPERPFLADLRARPDLDLERNETMLHCSAEEMPSPAGHRRIRDLLAAKYGWADTFVGLLVDTSRSIAVRLTCAAP